MQNQSIDTLSKVTSNYQATVVAKEASETTNGRATNAAVAAPIQTKSPLEMATRSKGGGEVAATGSSDNRSMVQPKLTAASQEVMKNASAMQEQLAKQKNNTARRNIRFGQTDRNSPQDEAIGNELIMNSTQDGGVPVNTIRSGGSDI